ncbi:MAG: collagen-like protein [Actinobacteria bacterium]|nr:collagen-like protein [Actinomycetota bacterium]
MHRLRARLSYANVISTLCLILLLGGGTAYAASHLGKESVGARQLKKGAVTPAKLSTTSKAVLTGPAGARGATGPQGPKGDTGAPGPSGFTRGFQKLESGSSVSLGTSLFGTTAISLPVPTGTYFVTTDMEFLGSGANLAFCRLINGVGGPESEAVLREQSVPVGSAANLTISGLFTVRAGQEMNVECSRTSPGTTLDVDRINISAVQIQEKTTVPNE